jgi:hypothetical protein
MGVEHERLERYPARTEGAADRAGWPSGSAAEEADANPFPFRLLVRRSGSMGGETERAERVRAEGGDSIMAASDGSR